MNHVEDRSSTGPRFLDRSASGLRHLRWVREILGTLRGFASFEARLSEAQRAALRDEIDGLTAVVAGLSGAVKPYRDFLERERTLWRGKGRAARFLASEENSVAAPPDAGAAASSPRDAVAGIDADVQRRRETLRAALAQQIDGARGALRGMNERLIKGFSAEMVAALYPELTADLSRVLDDGDPDDDSAGAA